MFGQTYGHNLIRKYVIYFGTVFNNIWLNRYDINDNLIQRNKVPINYGPREKFLARLEGNDDLRRPIAIQLPRMSFEMVDLRYDPTRKLNSLNRICRINTADPTGYSSQYMPVPYDIVFRLSIMVKNVLDGTYIVEQILPYFAPSWQATLTVNDDLGTKHDVPIMLNDITQEDTYEGYFEQRRAIIWNLTFTMKAWFFGPTSIDTNGIIKQMDLNFRPVSSNLDVFEDANANTAPTQLKVQISPGIDLNNLPVNFTNGFKTLYGLNSPNGVFTVTEKVTNTTNLNDFAYVKEANSSFITSLKTSGTLQVGDSIIGALSGTTATISNTSIVPVIVDYDDVPLDADYGFIYDIFDSIG